jgi:hypothetical protein
MSGPERSYIDSVHRQITPEWKLHKQSNTGMMGANGTPDYYYERFRVATWIEYKYIKKIPARFLITDPACKFKLSPLQRRWLNRAVTNQVRVAVVLGSEEGALIIEQGRWEEYISVHDNRIADRINTPSDVAHFAASLDGYRIAI